MSTRAANGRSTIYLGKDGYWHGRVSMGSGPGGSQDRRHVRAKTQSLVTAKVRKLEQARDAGAVAITGRTTLVDFVDQWVTKKERLQVVRPNTIDGYRNDLAHVRAALPKVPLNRLGANHIEHLWSYLLGRGLKISHTRRTLNAALNDAVKRGLIARSPVTAAETPRDPETEVVPYTTDQMAALLATARGTRSAARWTVAMALGLRQGEVLGLCWDDLHLPSDPAIEGTLMVRRQLQRVTWRHGCPDPAKCLTRAGQPTRRAALCPQRWGGGLKTSPPKSEAGRRKLVIPATLTSELRAHRKEQLTERLASEVWEPGPSGGWVFTDEAGRPIDPRADNRAFKDLCRSAGLPEKRLHDLRHSAATMMLDSDVDLKTAGHLLGHSRVAQTERYQHVLADRKSVAAARIDQALFGQRHRQS